MKSVLKVFFALFLAWIWFIFSGEKTISITFFFVVLFILFFRPYGSEDSPIRDQYIEKLKENIKKSQEVQEQFSQEKNMTYKDFRKKEK